MSKELGNRISILLKKQIMKLFLKSDITTNHEVVLEIGYHHEKSLGHGDILHVHVHNTPGVEHHGQADKFVIKPGHPLYDKYKKLFKGG